MSRDLQMAQLRVPHAGRVQDHQHRAVRQIVGGIDHPGDFLDAQDLRQPTRGFGIRRVVEQVASLQRLHEEEAQRRDVEANRPRLAASARGADTPDRTGSASDSAGRADT